MRDMQVERSHSNTPATLAAPPSPGANLTANQVAHIMMDPGLSRIVHLEYVPYGNARTDANGTITCQHGPRCARPAPPPPPSPQAPARWTAPWLPAPALGSRLAPSLCLHGTGTVQLRAHRRCPPPPLPLGWGGKDPASNCPASSPALCCRECELNRLLSCAIGLNPLQQFWFPYLLCVERSAMAGADADLDQVGGGKARAWAQQQLAPSTPLHRGCLPRGWARADSRMGGSGHPPPPPRSLQP